MQGLIDTHCHIHERDYPLPVDDVLRRAAEAGVGKMICVGTSEQSSEDAIKLASKHENLFASVGVHPHDTKDGWEKIGILAKQHAPHPPRLDAGQGSSEARNEPYEKYGEVSTGDANVAMRQETPAHPAALDGRAAARLVAVGEIGLDYYYNHSPRDVQIKALEAQIQIALDHDLPIIFHVRDAFDDFWPILDNFSAGGRTGRIRAELHSFTDNQANLDKAFERGLYVGVNGISTFTKDPMQQKLYANIPIDKMLLETDAPFLTPVPYRGKTNEPAYVREIAMHHARLRGMSMDELAAVTTANASMLFNL